MQVDATKKEKTNKKMMILSCIGIILVVLGHTGNQINLAGNIFPYYSFHMVLFIFISGYFYNPNNENNLLGRNGYILKKIKKLIIPYFMWNLIYGIIVMIFKGLNIITYGESITLNSLFVKPWIFGHQYILNLASWFLLALFLVNIVYVLIRKVITKFRIWNDYVIMTILGIIAIYSIYLAKQNIGEAYIPLLRTGFFLFFYQFGYIYKTKIEGKLKINTVIYFLILLVIQLIILKLDKEISYEAVFMKFKNRFMITPIFVGITGILFWIKIAEILEPSLGKSKIINYISDNTYDIMLHHLFWTFLLNVFIWKISNIANLEGFNVERFRKTIYYSYTPGVVQAQIIYTIIAIAMPLIVRFGYEKLKNIVLNKYRKDILLSK